MACWRCDIRHERNERNERTMETRPAFTASITAIRSSAEAWPTSPADSRLVEESIACGMACFVYQAGVAKSCQIRIIFDDHLNEVRRGA